MITTAAIRGGKEPSQPKISTNSISTTQTGWKILGGMIEMKLIGTCATCKRLWRETTFLPMYLSIESRLLTPLSTTKQPTGGVQSSISGLFSIAPNGLPVQSPDTN